LKGSITVKLPLSSSPILLLVPPPSALNLKLGKTSGRSGFVINSLSGMILFPGTENLVI